MAVTQLDIIKALIRKSTGAWFETYAKIWSRDRTKGLITPKLNYLQRKIQRVMEKMEDEELPVRIIEVKPRARGSTTYITGIGYTKMRRDSTSAVFIGGQSDQTVGLWNMMKTYHANDAFDWKNSGDVNEKGASFSNGSRAKKETAKDVQAGIGDTYQFLQATEAARWSNYGVANAAEVMGNILKAVPLLHGTYVFLESTAEGAAGDFYQRWLSAVDADDFLSGKKKIQPGDYVRIFAPWFNFEESVLPRAMTEEDKLNIEKTIDGESWYHGEQYLLDNYAVECEDGVRRIGNVITNADWREQLAWRRYAIEKECSKNRATFDRDFPHSWQTAFQKSGGQRFDMDGTARMRKIAKKWPPRHGLLETAKDGRLVFRDTAENESKQILFENPIKGCRYIVAVDPMTGESQVGGLDPDLHSVVVLRDGYYNEKGMWRSPAMVARVVPCRWDLNVLEPEIFKLAQYYGSKHGCTIVVEVNQDRGLIELLKLRSANLYQRQIFNQIEQKTTNAYGFQTNEKTREMLIEKLAGCIRCVGEEGNGIEIYDELTLDELENFVRKRNGRCEASDGWHDDQVFGVALGLQVIGHGTIYWPPAVNTWYQPPEMRMGGQKKLPGAFS